MMDQSLAERSYQYIREKVSCGELEPGKRLVNRTLASQIGVSVIPVREAIYRLASEGLIEHIPGAGAFVRKPDRHDIDNLYVLRDALESCAAAEAAKMVTAGQLEEFEYLLEGFRLLAVVIAGQPDGHSSQAQQDRWLDEEERFHELLIEASHNALLAKVVHGNRAIGNVFEAQRRDPPMLTTEVAKATCLSKAELIQALRDRDPERARTLMSAQIQRGRRLVTDHFRLQRKNRI